MKPRHRVLLIVGCVVCLLALSSALPAADPRLDAPGTGDGEGAEAGSWDEVVETGDDGEDDDPGTDPPSDADTDTEGDPEADPDPGPTADLRIQGAVVPGNTVRVEHTDWTPFDDFTVQVDNETVGELDNGGLDITVPYAEEMTVAVPSESLSRTVDVRTNASIELTGDVAQNREVTAAVTVGSTPVPDVQVYQDGEAVGETDGDGELTVTMPERVGTTALRAERGPLAAERSIDLPGPTVTVDSPFLFPGLPAPVEVTADGAGVPNATVTVAGGGTATTNEDGFTRVRLPIDNAATIATEVDGVRATTTVGRLYLRLTVAGVVLPGLIAGFIWTYFRLAARAERSEWWFGAGRGGGIAALFVALADGLASLFDSLGSPSFSWPSFSWPSLSLRWPSVGLPWLGVLGSLSAPSVSLPRPSGLGLGSLLSGRGSSGERDGGLASSIRDRLGFGDDEEDEEATHSVEAALADEPLGPPGPRAELRRYWHAFLDRVGLQQRETRTPGQAARRALAAGFPATQVRRLLGVFREVEYGGHDPSPEQVAEARAAADELLDHDPDEEGSE